MKRKVCLVILLFAIIGCLFILGTYNKEIYEEETEIIKKSDTLSMMIETGADTGEYELITASTWPSDGYIFNETLSKCENGSKLSWDSENNVVLMEANTKDKCYVYFDVEVIYLSEFVISKYTGVQGENNIYYHDENLENGAGDYSYRYAGASVDVNNYVCFGSNDTPCLEDNLYRIIGVFTDENHGVIGQNLVKLIKADYATSVELGTDGGDYQSDTYSASDLSSYLGTQTIVNRYYWNRENCKNARNDTGYYNVWSYSALNKTNLNKNYITYLSDWAEKIESVTWKVGGHSTDYIYSSTASVAYQKEVISPVTKQVASTYTAKIGLVYVSDYGYAALSSAWTTTLNRYRYNDILENKITAENWMYMGLNEWTITRSSDDTEDAFYISNNGQISYGIVENNSDDSWGIAVRPTFYLKPSTTYVSGTGSIGDPIQIN